MPEATPAARIDISTKALNSICTNKSEHSVHLISVKVFGAQKKMVIKKKINLDIDQNSTAKGDHCSKLKTLLLNQVPDMKV